ncbi:MAG: hypothetical protein LBD74_03540 [Spirochaetaceae bacterium]|jgi:hypothetical protein|nr:hypothetical protein [Spirochaetaceae bacterium]
MRFGRKKSLLSGLRAAVPGIGSLLILVAGCASTREVHVLYQYTAFSGLSAEDMRDAIFEVFRGEPIPLLEALDFQGYTLETPWVEEPLRGFDLVMGLFVFLAGGEPGPEKEARRYVRYYIRVEDTHYQIWGETLSLDPHLESLADRAQAAGAVPMVPHTEAWDVMERLVQEINQRLAVGFYDYEIRRETIGVR